MVADSKNRFLIAGSVALVITGIGVFIYSTKQKKLYNDILGKIRSTDSVSDGAYNDWRDVYACDCWNPQYLTKSGVAPTSLDYTDAANAATKIYKAKGTITNNQDDVVAIFNTFKTKADIARVAQMFSDKKYGKLVDFLKSFMESALGRKNYMQDIYDIVKRLPN